MWEGVWVSACVFVICFCLSSFFACFFAKAEISWLGTIRGDSECKAELFLFVSDISTWGHMCVCACVSVCFLCFSKNFVRRVCSHSSVSMDMKECTLWNRAINFFTCRSKSGLFRSHASTSRVNSTASWELVLLYWCLSPDAIPDLLNNSG